MSVVDAPSLDPSFFIETEVPRGRGERERESKACPGGQDGVPPSEAHGERHISSARGDRGRRAEAKQRPRRQKGEYE